MRTATVFAAEYRARGYDSEDESMLREELEAFGAVRLRPLHLPEAGGSLELSLVVQFIGLAAAGGIVEHITQGLFRRLCSALLRFYRAKTRKAGFGPEMTLRVSYDDLDLEIGPVTERELESLPNLAQLIHEHLASGGLEGREVFRIVIGMVNRGAEWVEPTLWEQAEDAGRFWGISLEGHRQVTHIYDTQTRLLSEKPSTWRGPLKDPSADELP